MRSHAGKMLYLLCIVTAVSGATRPESSVRARWAEQQGGHLEAQTEAEAVQGPIEAVFEDSGEAKGVHRRI